MFTATTQRGSVTWDRGALTGDEDHVRTVEAAIPGWVAFNYWGERAASLEDEFSAYITVGYALQSVYGDVTISPVPDNPDGYEEEGVWPDEGGGGSLLAAAYGRHVEEFYNKNHSKADGRFTSGPGGLPKGNTETWANKKARLTGLHEGALGEMVPIVRQVADKFRAAITEDAEVRVRVPFSAILRVSKQGLKSQHETDRSQGAFSPHIREAVESRMFSAAETRPIYGYVPVGREHAENLVYNYGQLAVVLTPEAKARTTVTRGDSLTVSVTGSEHSKDEDRRIAAGLDDAPAPIKFSEVHSASDERLFSATTEGKGPNDEGYVNYFETQTHGGVRVKDIAKIILPNEPYKWQGYYQNGRKWMFNPEHLQELFPNAIIEVAEPYTRY